MKFKAIILALFLGIAGICFAADNAAEIKAAAATEIVAAGENTSSASEAPQKKPSASGQWMQMLMPIILIVVMILIFSRSNKKQQQKRQEMLDRIVKGSRVLLNSGVYGKVSEVRKNEFLIEIAEGVKVLVIKNGVATVEDEESKNGEAK
jgi:preprotein translocase subunit YajC